MSKSPAVKEKAPGLARSWHRIAMARERAGLSAHQVEHHAPDLYALEAQPEPTEEEMAKAAKAYHVSLCWIRGHESQQMGGDFVLALVDAQLTLPDERALTDFALSLGQCADCGGER